ncbi:hypothetical protein CC78DRAFT_613069 [Lojkania enalia]|uniref:RNA exonuclease 4 n=1 Tax=Lojkania enalia TaxID=147567 RepID=A0A9P4KIR6_9PLEO|nr:hypothetical protein CC78DRAFT_613069 [Didymosphaeria enalia]
MAPIELSNLSSNWKKLQKTLQSPKPPSTSAKSEPSKAEAKLQHNSLKRKRATDVNGEHTHTSSKLKGRSSKPLPSRKRQKMEEPPQVGASTKHADHCFLGRSISMPALRQPTLLTNPKAKSQSLSVLSPHSDYPDIENEGISSSALPGKYIALDCEMVGTGPEPSRDSALARVSVVNYHGHQVYDSYVQVKVPVTDYRTEVSGIEPRHIHRSYARVFKEVQSDISILLSGRILVGHAVKNDLDALLLKHDKRYTRDTSKYSKFREFASIPGRTPSLKGLVERLLGVEIQVGRHSSVEDARATMALFRLEKEGFDAEVLKTYGSVKLAKGSEARREEVEAFHVGGGEMVKRRTKRKKKKKKH